MSKFRLVVALVFCAAVAAAQSRISPRIARSGSSAYVIVFRRDADMAGARQAVLDRGFDVLSHSDLLPNHLLAGGPRSRLAELEELDDLTYILPASTDLQFGRRLHACAGGVTSASGAALAAHYVLNGQGWAADAYGMVALNFAFVSLPAALESNAARNEIERALHEWERYTNLTFSSATDPDAPRTLAFRFVSGAHGDAYPFDGHGGMLAHTFYPPPLNPEPVAGDLHFDADEEWHVGVSTDLFTVVLHEAGHALGLAHSDQPGAVMYPYYRQAYALTSDDIAAIQSLYGVRGATPTVPPAPAGAPPPPAASAPGNPPPAPPAPVPSPDRKAPFVRITSPGAAVVSTAAASLPIAGAASDDTGVVAVRWSTSTGDSGTAAGTTSWSFSAPLYPGSTVVTVRAYDAAGNSGWRSITVFRR